jgi:hypothetical protein
MRYTVDQCAAIRAVGTFQRPSNTDKFDLQALAAGSHHRIAMPTDINEGEVRCNIGISLGQSSTCIAGSLQRQARSHSIHY